VICSVSSARQLEAVVQAVEGDTKKAHNVRPYHVDGKADEGWVLVDYSDVIVHVFMDEKRRYYNLEDFWREATVVVNIQ
jgi:ribosome-associated protein